MLTIGTGIGGCILLNGEVFHGFSNSACEVGYMHMDDSDFQTLGAASILTKKVAAWKGEPAENWSGYHIFEEAKKGKTVSMICSGDAGVYGMAGLMYEVGVNYPETELEIIPGVTAATGGAAVLGAPLIHDFCLISLSDLLTPWEKIEARLLAAAQADFVVCLYNPSSKKRHDYLQKACDLMMKYKSPDTICGTVSNIARDGEEAHVMTLKELRDTQVDMFTTVFIGNSQTKEISNKMVTPRGYRNV